MNVQNGVYLALILLGWLSAEAMQKDPEFPVVVYNSLKRAIKVSWTLSSGQGAAKRIEPEKKAELCSFDRLKADTPIRYEVDGTFFRWTGAPLEIDKPELLKQAYKLRLDKCDALCITVSQPTIYLQVAYSREAFEGKPKSESLLELFSGFDAYPELRSCLTVEKILGFTSYKAPLHSQDDGSLIMTAEDIYRAILLVDRDYDHDAIKNACIQLKLRWKSDALCKDRQKKRRAETVLELVEKAFHGLDHALLDRSKSS